MDDFDKLQPHQIYCSANCRKYASLERRYAPKVERHIAKNRPKRRLADLVKRGQTNK